MGWEGDLWGHCRLTLAKLNPAGLAPSSLGELYVLCTGHLLNCVMVSEQKDHLASEL